MKQFQKKQKNKTDTFKVIDVPQLPLPSAPIGRWTFQQGEKEREERRYLILCGRIYRDDKEEVRNPNVFQRRAWTAESQT